MRQFNQGSILILALFVLISLSIILISFSRMIIVDMKMVFLKTKNLQAYYAAQAGIADAIYEIKLGNTWSSRNIGTAPSQSGKLDPQWHWARGNPIYKLYKTNSLPVSDTTALTYFDYPVTYSVSVTFDNAINPTNGTINIISESTIEDLNQKDRNYSKKIFTKAVKTVNNEVYILENKEI